ncbi:MAG: alpha/beta hydrolase family protein [Candidatus Dormibacteria bacterium]
MPDERIRSALEHWGPRFTVNGVDPSDFQKVTGALQRWSEWCAAWSRAAEEHADLGAAALAAGRNRSAGAHYARASVYYHFAKFVFVEDLEQMRVAHQHAVECLNLALPHLDPPGRRIEIPFEGARMVGVLRTPAGPGPHPGVVMIPGLDSTKEEFRTTEQLFLERGLATFSVDGPGQGESEYDLPARPDWEVPGAVILDALEQLPELDRERIGIWGVSLGGYYGPRLAAVDQRVRACVAQAGPYNWGACWDILPELSREAFRVRTRSVSAEAARQFALTFSLEGFAARIKVPLQIVFGKRDRLIPWQQAERLAKEAGGPVELLMFDDGNHVCTNIPYRHRYRSADWMAEQLR